MKLPFPLSLSSKKDLKNLKIWIVRRSFNGSKVNGRKSYSVFWRKTFEATIKLLCRKEKKDKNNLVWHSKFWICRLCNQKNCGDRFNFYLLFCRPSNYIYSESSKGKIYLILFLSFTFLSIKFTGLFNLYVDAFATLKTCEIVVLIC